MLGENDNILSILSSIHSIKEKYASVNKGIEKYFRKQTIEKVKENLKKKKKPSDFGFVGNIPTQIPNHFIDIDFGETDQL